jgi:PAS domain S-box-containing protein
LTLTFDKWLSFGLGLLVVALLADTALIFRSTQQLHDGDYWIAHTHEVILTLDDFLSTMKDAETGQRGYIITGDKLFLQPYESARVAIDDELASIQRLTTDNPRQQTHLPRLLELVHAKTEELARTIAMRDELGLVAAQKEVAAHLGRNLMDSIRGVVAEMTAEERGLLRERQIINYRAYRTALVSGALAALLGLTAILAFVGILRRHLSARARAAAMLHEQREWFRTTLASIGDAVIATDSSGNVVFQNAVAESLTGWPGSEAEGQPLDAVFRIVNEATRKTVENPAVRAIRDGNIVALANHTVLLSKAGVEWPIDDSASPIRDQNGQIAGAVLVFREITARKQEEEIRQAQHAQLVAATDALREADHAKDEFLATLAHELRNPLAPIRNAVQILQSRNLSESEVSWSRDVIGRQAGVMALLLDDLLDVSRITRRKLELRRERIAIDSVVANAVETSGPLFRAAGHSLTLDCPSDPVYVDADPIRLAQVIANLLNNAAKYTDPGGKILLSVRKEGGEAVVSVRDNGIGISPEMLPRIFEMFSQATPALARSQNGLGIGLALVRGLVELHGGTVAAHSDGAGKGSEFVVRLPSVTASSDGVAESSATRPTPPPASSARRVLVAEDNTDAAESLVLLLRLERHDVEVAHNGRRAVEVADTFRPEVVLLDIGLPELNGYEVARRIREQPWGKSMTLVALTGWGQEEDRRAAEEAGFDHHFVKPLDPAVLLRLLADVDTFLAN